MTRFTVTILGSNSAIPTATRHPTAQLLNVNQKYFLIDCGEGTQIQLRKYRLKMQRINQIFISHMHGDHYFGLIGLLTTLHLLGREKALHLFAPGEMKNIIDVHLAASEIEFRYQLVFHPLEFSGNQRIFENNDITVETIKLKHRIPCNGFLFREKTKTLNIKKEVIKKYNLTIEDIKKVKQGADVEKDGRVIKNELLTTPPPAPRAYAYCSDTAYTESFLDQIKGIDMLYHEATFLDDLVERAHKTSHTTASEAAKLADKAGVKRLIIGHYSARYKSLEPFLQEAKTAFKNTELALEGDTYTIE